MGVSLSNEAMALNGTLAASIVEWAFSPFVHGGVPIEGPEAS
jgi:hypothetical protein